MCTSFSLNSSIISTNSAEDLEQALRVFRGDHEIFQNQNISIHDRLRFSRCYGFSGFFLPVLTAQSAEMIYMLWRSDAQS